jgi:hypothetical protein
VSVLRANWGNFYNWFNLLSFISLLFFSFFFFKKINFHILSLKTISVRLLLVDKIAFKGEGGSKPQGNFDNWRDRLTPQHFTFYLFFIFLKNKNKKILTPDFEFPRAPHVMSCISYQEYYISNLVILLLVHKLTKYIIHQMLNR